MAIQKLIDYLGFSRQVSGKGTPETVAVFGLGLLGGSSFMLPIDQEAERQTLSGTASSRLPNASFRTGAHPGAGPRFRVYPLSFPLFCYSALGNLTTTGAGPFTHTAKPAVTLPYFTLFGRKASDHERVTDAVCNSLSISWSERNPLEAEASFMGANFVMGAASPTVTNDESLQKFFGPLAGTLQYDVNSAIPVTGKVVGGSIEINNNVEEVPVSASLTPDDVFPAAQEISGTITVKPDNLNDWRAALTGTDAGTTLSVDPIYGSFSIGFTDGTNTVTFAAGRVPMMTEFPEADPAGGAVELELAFVVNQLVAGGDAFTVVAVNTKASY